MAILPSQTRSIGTLSKNKNNQSFSLELKKKQRFNLLSIIPIGFGADKGPGIAQVAYTLSCQLRKEEDIEIGQNVPISTSAIDAYWWAYWQTAVQIKGSAGNKLDILNASPLDDMSRTAHAEWKPIKQEIRQVDEEMEHYTELLEPITSIAYEYQNLRNEYADSINALIINKKITPNEYKEAARILESKKLSSAQSNKLSEITNHYFSLHNVCSEASSADQAFSSVKTIGMKGEVVVSSSRLRSLYLSNKKLPEKDEIERVLKRFHFSLSKLAPAKKALNDFGKYWKKNENEANAIIAEIKRLYPQIK